MIDIEIEEEAWTEALPNAEDLARTAAGAVLEHELRDDANLTLLLTDDDTVRDLNDRFRKQDKPTNVLSFPAPANPDGLLGDVALAYGVCAREAEAQGKSIAHHLQHLVAHGVLHLLGYDHLRDDEAEEMEALEREILAGLGVPDPYAAGEDDDDGP